MYNISLFLYFWGDITLIRHRVRAHISGLHQRRVSESFFTQTVWEQNRDSITVCCKLIEWKGGGGVFHTRRPYPSSECTSLLGIYCMLLPGRYSLSILLEPLRIFDTAGPLWSWGQIWSLVWSQEELSTLPGPWVWNMWNNARKKAFFPTTTLIAASHIALRKIWTLTGIYLETDHEAWCLPSNVHNLTLVQVCSPSAPYN